MSTYVNIPATSSGSGAITVTANTGLSGVGTSGSPLAGTPATAAAPGTMSAANFLGLNNILPKFVALTDADTSLSPTATQIGGYYMPTGTLTANRTFTLSDVPGAQQGLWIYRLDSSAFTMTIKKADGTTIFGFPASQKIAGLFFGSGGLWGFFQPYIFLQ